MKKYRIINLLTLLTIFGLVSCVDTNSSVTSSNSSKDSTSSTSVEDSSGDSSSITNTGTINLSNASPRLDILESVVITPSFLDGASPTSLIVGDYDTNKVLIEQNNDENHSLTVTCLASDTDEKITLSGLNGITATLRVRSTEADYNDKASQDNENWFTPLTGLTPLSNPLNSDMPLGVDVSYVKQIYDNGGHYFNQDGIEEPIFKILKDAGYTAVRIKQFVDPFNYEIGEEPVSYGGGTNDAATNLWLAKWASHFGLDVMIDFHYSDFYAHPGQQIIPKAWKDVSSSDEMVALIEEYTKESLQLYKDNNIDIKYIQIGNEVTTGLLHDYPGDDVNYLTGDNPGYVTKKSTYRDLSVSGSLYGGQFAKYVKAGNDAAKEIYPNAQTIIHIARGFTGTNIYDNVYDALVDVDYDIIGVSCYIWNQGRPSALSNLLTHLNEKYPSKKVMICEVSYGFTLEGNSNATNLFSDYDEEGEKPVSGYDVSPSGQALLLRDYLDVMNNALNGYGMFYWGGDFIPVNGSGWADSLTKSTWANQALFSYNGKALPSLYFLNELK